MKYKSNIVKVERAGQELCIEVFPSRVRIGLTKDRYNIVSIFLPRVNINKNILFDTLLREDGYEAGEYRLELSSHCLSLHHGDQIQAVDFRGPFSKKDIFNAIRANQVDDKQAQLAKELEEAKKSLHDAQERVRTIELQMGQSG